MNDILYFECFSGISGDMVVAALIDLGANKDLLLNGIESLNISGYEIKMSRCKKCGIDAFDFDVITSHSHVHRNINDIFDIIDNSKISYNAKVISKNIFTKIGEAEAKAHNKKIDEIHFHEVGAIDSIIDIVSVAICIDDLGIKRFIFSKICEGQGYSNCQHGILPVPVPAVLNIFSNSNLNMSITENNGEMITPTGAAIAATLCNEYEMPKSFKIKKVGIGAGKKDFENANILRVSILYDCEKYEENMIVVETNIDDSTPEAISYTMDKLFENGANDVFLTPIYMKKNRPSTKLSVICDNSKYYLMVDIIFNNLTTIGVRKYNIERYVMERKVIDFKSSLGYCRIKVCTFNKDEYIYPEFDDIKILCEKNNIGFEKCMNIVKYECRNNK